VLNKLDGKVQRFASRDDAERAARRLKKEFGLNIEQATPEERVHEPTCELRLRRGDPPDAISVTLDEKTGTRYLLLCDDGEEIAGNNLDDDVADMLVRILQKTKTLLGEGCGKRRA
jgi:hypothetical protein